MLFLKKGQDVVIVFNAAGVQFFQRADLGGGVHVKVGQQRGIHAATALHPFGNQFGAAGHRAGNLLQDAVARWFHDCLVYIDLEQVTKSAAPCANDHFIGLSKRRARQKAAGGRRGGRGKEGASIDMCHSVLLLRLVLFVFYLGRSRGDAASHRIPTGSPTRKPAFVSSGPGVGVMTVTGVCPSMTVYSV